MHRGTEGRTQRAFHRQRHGPRRGGSPAPAPAQGHEWCRKCRRLGSPTSGLTLRHSGSGPRGSRRRRPSPGVDGTRGAALSQPGRFLSPEATLVTSPDRCPGAQSDPKPERTLKAWARDAPVQKGGRTPPREPSRPGSRPVISHPRVLAKSVRGLPGACTHRAGRPADSAPPHTPWPVLGASGSAVCVARGSPGRGPVTGASVGPG